MAVLVAEQGRSLDDIVGAAEAARVQQILADAAELLRTTVHARIERRAADYDGRFPMNTAERDSAQQRALAAALPARLYAAGDAHEEHACPACGSKAWLVGFEWQAEVLESSDHTDPFGLWVEVVQVIYEVEEFRCPECGLTLAGRDEIEIADLPAEFTRKEEREPDYEPDYGND